MRAWQSGKNLLCNSADTYVKQMGICFFYVIGNFVPITQKRSAGMRTAAYNADVASDRRRCKNVRALEQYGARRKRRSGRNKINKVPKYVRYSELCDLRHGLYTVAFMGEA